MAIFVLLGHPDHLVDGGFLIAKEVDPADVESGLEGIVFEGQCLGRPQEEIDLQARLRLKSCSDGAGPVKYPGRIRRSSPAPRTGRAG